MNDRIQTLYTSASALLDEASQELNRPSRDVVTYSACIGGRRALYQFLQVLAAIDQGEVVLDRDYTLEELLNLGREKSEKLREIDFSQVHCQCDYILREGQEETRFCDSVQRVQLCAELADRVRSLVDTHSSRA